MLNSDAMYPWPLGIMAYQGEYSTEWNLVLAFITLTILPAVSPPPYAEYVSVIIDSGVKVVETAGNSPKEFIARFKEAGVKKVWVKARDKFHAKILQKVGADKVINPEWDMACASAVIE